MTAYRMFTPQIDGPANNAAARVLSTTRAVQASEKTLTFQENNDNA